MTYLTAKYDRHLPCPDTICSINVLEIKIKFEYKCLIFFNNKINNTNNYLNNKNLFFLSRGLKQLVTLYFLPCGPHILCSQKQMFSHSYNYNHIVNCIISKIQKVNWCM